AHDAGLRGFEFERSAAVALRGLAAVEDHVTDLARVLINAVDDLSIPDDAASDSGPDPETDDVAVTPGRSRQVFAEHSHVDVVVENDRNCELFGEDLPDRESAHSDVGRAQDDARARVERSGGADPESDDLFL